jgi:hypothetical protein
LGVLSQASLSYCSFNWDSRLWPGCYCYLQDLATLPMAGWLEKLAEAAAGALALIHLQTNSFWQHQ